MKHLKLVAKILLAFSFVGCAGMQRSCESNCAGQVGADWLVVQYDYDGKPIQCWKLDDVSVANEDGSDGIYWLDSHGNLVHISGWYNRVQIGGGAWTQAAKDLRVDLESCL